ncbi:MAG: sulfatase family protein [Bacteroidales bacterium]
MRKTLLYTFILLVGSLAACTTENKSTDKKPNIIYVLTDDLGYGDLKCFNTDSKIKTPQLDQMAADGMIFTDAHTSSSVCTPTRYAVLTGRYNWRTKLKKGVLTGESSALLNPARETVASLLKKAGYHTAFIGKWHLGWDWAKDSNGNIDFSKPVENAPNVNGFDYSYGHCGSLDMPPYVYVENGMSTAIPTDSTENKNYQGMWRKGLTAPDFIHEEVTPHFFQKSFDYIKKEAKNDEPFFLYLPLPSPHTPILPSEEWQGKSGLNPYGDFVMMVDDYMGQLLKVVKDAGIDDNTLIIFTSDNGCSPRAKFSELKEKGHNPSYIFRGYKADIFEGGHRVPFIVKWPRVIEGGASCDKTICLTDLIATAASVSGSKLVDNAGEDSFDMLPLFKKQDAEYKRGATVHHSVNGSFAIRKGDWKLILCPGSGGWSYPSPKKSKELNLPPFQLYNLADDPGEQNNLIDKHPEVEQELKTLLTEYVKNGRSTPGTAQQNDGEQWWEQLSWMEK